jgi:hydroxymethylpyrimidine pyrophosphatase-like HAD family hydrolase
VSSTKFAMNNPDYRPTHPDRPFLLAADLDGTLLGDEPGEALLKDTVERHRPGLHLAYVTGRFLASVRELVAAGRLPVPDFVCYNVGTQIITWGDPQNSLGRKYAGRVPPGWDLESVYARGTGQGVRPQDFGGDQPPYQAGFYWDGREESLAAFRERLADHGSFRILPSYGEFIDVFPAGFGKGEAVHFLRGELGLVPERVVVAGDSGNDLEMFETGYRGILPVNALDELKAAAREAWHYHSPLPAARGVLDGLVHFGYLEGERSN